MDLGVGEDDARWAVSMDLWRDGLVALGAGAPLRSAVPLP